MSAIAYSAYPHVNLSLFSFLFRRAVHGRRKEGRKGGLDAQERITARGEKKL